MFIFLDQLVISLAVYEIKNCLLLFIRGQFIFSIGYARGDALSLDDLTSK